MTPCYKTLTLRLYAPGRAKRALLDNAVLRYTRALELLLRLCRARVEGLSADARVTRVQAAALADAQTMRALNVYDVQPFKDSLKVDFTNTVLAYLARLRRSDGRVSYPCVRLEPDEAAALFDARLREAEAGKLPPLEAQGRIDWVCAREGRLHSLYFGRYAAQRDYCLLYAPESGRFFAKLHLLSAAQRVPAPPQERQELRVVAPGLPPARDDAAKRRYIIVPLAFGKRQEAMLRQALTVPRMLHTARLVRRADGAYDLVVSVEVQAGPSVRPRCTMGLARAPGGVCCTVRASDGATLDERMFPTAPGAAARDTVAQRGGQALFSLARAAAALAVSHRAQVVLEADGGRGDGLTAVPASVMPAFPVWRYARLTQLLRCKLVEAGLPAPALVSGKGLFAACPRCGCVTRKNRLTAQLFICTACGYAAPAQFVASRNLAARLEKYATNKIPISVHTRPDGSRQYTNAVLGFACALPPGADEAQVCYELRLFVNEQLRLWTAGKKYAMLRKLHDASDLLPILSFRRRSTPRSEAGGQSPV